MTVEQPWKNALVRSLDDAIAQLTVQYGAEQPAGIFVWRLNSDNWVFENMWQVALYNRIHSKLSPDDLDDKVNNGFALGGRNQEENGHPIPPWVDNDWIQANEYRA